MDSNINRKHKDSVFSALFSMPEVLRELYSAIEGIDVPKDAIININTLSDVLYMCQINDISFTIDDRIVVLIEHQSTINNNVPVRLLMYIAHVYEKILERDKLYHKKQIEIPIPEFFILYNGTEPYPDHTVLKLSTAFKNIKNLKLYQDSLPLELIVHVYNINQGRNSEILKKCKTLESYSIFIEKIRELNKDTPLDESVKAAVKYCVENNILKSFLRSHGSEVINMLTDDITIDEIVAVRSKEAWEDGLEEGREKERNYFLELLDQGLSVNEIKQRLSCTQTANSLNNAQTVH
ncbi:MAG: Rpn family recombination-promoting nuclease/putative transposase [Treponema sp.]|nr:Rpn family recombination-promoting nuclease/putative transposase [Treponema sp.]